ncbi:hypothetical protein [Pseudonocardia thermophila]|jgi:hypothetical protein|uniref:hypothetical protein n=1 Tax=Pseudonocardia thermophila TaxID=1848 RepID=UPI00248E901C|nr:hypothetical protein [Pseudonocardia thermophila]
MITQADNADIPMPAPVNPGKVLCQIVVDAATLLGRNDDPAELVGYGPIPAELAANSHRTRSGSAC